jgi:glutaminyl-tRNA synthetase
LADVQPLDNFQFQRLGYFAADKTSQPGQLVFNKTVGLRDSWTKSNK